MVAHPDDDTNGNAGVLLLAGDRVRYTLICATSGGSGLIGDPSLATPENLAQVREAEELESLRVVGTGDPEVHFLGYPDGELADVPRQELAERIEAILRATLPHVVVTFGPDGITGHPDHVVVGWAATEAFRTARRRVAGEEAFRRLYYHALPASRLERFRVAMRARGLDPGDPDDPLALRGVPDGTIAVDVDCTAVYGRKLDALAAHRTQAGESAGVPQDIWRILQDWESFVQAFPPGTEPGGRVASSLFDGL